MRSVPGHCALSFVLSLVTASYGNVDDIGNLFVSGRTLGPKEVGGPVLDEWLARVVDPVPEPSAAILLLGGAAMVAARRRRRGA